jgi:lysophospholipase
VTAVQPDTSSDAATPPTADADAPESFDAQPAPSPPAPANGDFGATAGAAATRAPATLGWSDDTLAPRTLPFADGRDGGLSTAVDFSRFLSMQDPREAELAGKLPALLDYLQTGQFGEFTGERGVPIRYGVFAPPAGVPVKGVVNLLTGSGESFSKYAETLFNLRDLRAQGWVVASMDHRSQGFSGRELGDPQVQYITDFEDFVRDESTFHGLLQKFFPNAPQMQVAHSMGGAIATRYLEEHPDDYQRTVLLSPMLEIDHHVKLLGERIPVPSLVEDVLVDVGDAVDPKAYAPGQHAYQPSTLASGTTHSQARTDVTNAIRTVFPETRVGGVSWQWLKQSDKADREMTRPDQLQKLKSLDVYLLSARDDTWVVPKAEDVAAGIAGFKQTQYPGMNHELLGEQDAGRDKALAQLRGLITSLNAS